MHCSRLFQQNHETVTFLEGDDIVKVGLVTLHGYFNYGNRLQNYALQESISKLGYDVESLVFQYPEDQIKNKLRKYYEKRNGAVQIKALKDIRRESKIEKFSKENIRTRFITLNEKNCAKVNNQYDAFIVGSDQIWNPLFWKKTTKSADYNAFMLRFASPQKRIAYAGSFGVEQLPEFWTELMAEEFKHFKLISVREEAGARIIDELTGVKPKVVLDPTMLLTAEEWKNKIQLCDKPGDYVLSFFLGEKSNEAVKYITQLKKANTKVIDLLDIRNGNYYVSGPDKFLELINNAAAVLTDSFHATVFSILFHTPFLTFSRIHNNRSNMNSRIITLLNKFELSDRAYTGQEVNLFSCDFQRTDHALEKAREESISYLKMALMEEGI